MKIILFIAAAACLAIPATAQDSGIGVETAKQAAELLTARAEAAAEAARLKREADARAEADRERAIRKIEEQVHKEQGKGKSQQK